MIAINLYLLERRDVPQPDEFARCVVAGSSEKDARQIANQGAKAEGYLWTDGYRVSAKLLGSAAEDVQGIILFSKDLE